MPHMTIYGAQMDQKWTGSGLEVTGSGPEGGQKWTWSVYLSVRMSIHAKHFPHLLDDPYARDLQAQGACALRFLLYKCTKIFHPLHRLHSNIDKIICKNVNNIFHIQNFGNFKTDFFLNLLWVAFATFTLNFWPIQCFKFT